MTPDIVRSVVKRHMKSTAHFILAESGAPCPVEVQSVGNEAIIGWYVNPASADPATLVFTTEAVHIARPTETLRVPINSIESCSQPDSKEAPRGLFVVAGDKECFLPVAGSHGDEGQFKDAYNLFSVIRELLLVERT